MKTTNEVLYIIHNLIENEDFRVRTGEFIVSAEDLEEFGIDLNQKASFSVSNHISYDGGEIELEGYVSNNERTYNLFSFREINAERLIELFLNL